MILVLGALFLVQPSQSHATDPAFDIFKAYTERSRIRVNYDYWDLVLNKTVLDVGESYRYAPRNREKRTGTRIWLGNSKPSWMEGNRVLFHNLTDEQIAEISEYRRALEALFDDANHSLLSKNEQLAYWLNLYNVTVYEQIALIYPKKNLRSTMRGKRGRPGVWDAKLLTVMGITMSLNDIMNEILIPNWQDPVVLYGLFQGSIGGPNIIRRAFTGRNVMNRLEQNGLNFVNSIRGVHGRGKTLQVSEFYQWGAAAFPNFEVDLMAHLREFSNKKTLEILDATTKIKASYYDWHIADLYNGADPRGGFGTMYASVLGAGGIANIQGFESAPTTGTYGMSSVSAIPEAELPEQARALMNALDSKYRIFGWPNTTVTIFELGHFEPVVELENLKPRVTDKAKENQLL